MNKILLLRTGWRVCCQSPKLVVKMILTVSDYENSAVFHRHTVFERANYASARENFSASARVEREGGAYAIASIKRGKLRKYIYRTLIRGRRQLAKHSFTSFIFNLVRSHLLCVTLTELSCLYCYCCPYNCVILFTVVSICLF